MSRIFYIALLNPMSLQALFCYWLTSNLFSLTYGLGESFLQIMFFLYVMFCNPTLN